ncbi:MAG TPA: hypothetical protein VKR58_03495, partial [Aquella sp.]|nr:hypothetical protein [Aquella sp.]
EQLNVVIKELSEMDDNLRGLDLSEWKYLIEFIKMHCVALLRYGPYNIDSIEKINFMKKYTNEKNKFYLDMLSLQIEYNKSYEEKRNKLDKINQYEKLCLQLEEYKTQLKAYYIYKKMTHVNGLTFELVKSKLKIIQKSMNDKLKLFSDYGIEIIFRNSVIDPNSGGANSLNIEIENRCTTLVEHSFELRIYENEKLLSNIRNGCQIEQFIVNIIFRLALNEIISVPKLNMFIIDNVPSIFNKNEMIYIKKLFTLIKNQYLHLVVISNDKNIIEMADHELCVIKPTGKHGFINNTESKATPQTIIKTTPIRIIKKKKPKKIRSKQMKGSKRRFVDGTKSKAKPTRIPKKAKSKKIQSKPMRGSKRNVIII